MYWKKLLHIILMTFLFLCISLVTSYGDNTVGFYPPQPKDVTVLVTKPNISMQLVLNENKVISTEMKINSEKVDVKYDEVAQTIYYIPSEHLKPGSYRVDLEVKLEGWANPIVQSWQFKVSDKAIQDLAPPNYEQKQALNYINIYRKLLELKELQLNDSLNAAATAHSNYMASNRTTTQDEFANRNGFTGVTPYNRAASFGYPGGYVTEIVTSGKKDYREAIDELLKAPYQRISFINPFSMDLGYGNKDKYYTFDLGGKKIGEDMIVVYPKDNQMDLPSKWRNVDSPNPLRLHSSKGEVGYPITLSYFTEKNIDKINIDRVTLKNSKGENVKVFINTPGQDKNLTDSIIIIPSSPLSMGQKYTVNVRGKITFQNKTTYNLDHTWSFSTAAVEAEQDAWKNYYIYEDLKSHWARDIVLNLLKKQIVTSKTNDSFKPEDKVSRGEFAEFVVKALGLQTKNYEGLLKDVPSYNTKAVYIESAYRAGIIEGVGNGLFMPNKLITREEMAVMILKAYENKKGNIDLKNMPSIQFSDRDQISAWAQDGTKAVVHLGIIKGRGNNKFAPKSLATRAEASTMISRMLEIF